MRTNLRPTQQTLCDNTNVKLKSWNTYSLSAVSAPRSQQVLGQIMRGLRTTTRMHTHHCCVVTVPACSDCVCYLHFGFISFPINVNKYLGDTGNEKIGFLTFYLHFCHTTNTFDNYLVQVINCVKYTGNKILIKPLIKKKSIIIYSKRVVGQLPIFIIVSLARFPVI